MESLSAVDKVSLPFNSWQNSWHFQYANKACSRKVKMCPRVFRRLWAPDKNTIQRLTRQFKEQGSVSKHKCHGDLRVWYLKNTQALWVAMQCTPGELMERATRQMEISCHSVQQIWHSSLHLFPYKIMVLHKWANWDKGTKMHFSIWATCKTILTAIYMELSISKIFDSELWNIHIRHDISQQNIEAE